MAGKALTLTIVIPVYNEERYLSYCLQAISDQIIKPDQVIVIDNGSTDSSIKIAKKFDFARIEKEDRKGVLYAAGRGFNAASGTVVGRIDADTILPPDWVHKVKKHFQDSSLSAVTGPVSYYDMPYKKANYWFDHQLRRLTYKYSPNTPFLYGSNMALRREVWQALTSKLCEDRSIHEDIDLAIHMSRGRHRICYDKDLLSGASGRRYNDSVRKFLSYIFMYKRTYKKHGIHSFWIYPAMFMWSLGYFYLRPWRRLWYLYLQKKNPALPYSPDARKNPMAN